MGGKIGRWCKTETGEKRKFCKLLIYENFYQGQEGSPRRLYGLVIKEDPDFITFKTKNKEYQVSKKTILSLEDTNIEFEGAWEWG